MVEEVSGCSRQDDSIDDGVGAAFHQDTLDRVPVDQAAVELTPVRMLDYMDGLTVKVDDSEHRLRSLMNTTFAHVTHWLTIFFDVFPNLGGAEISTVLLRDAQFLGRLSLAFLEIGCALPPPCPHEVR